MDAATPKHLARLCVVGSVELVILGCMPMLDGAAQPDCAYMPRRAEEPAPTRHLSCPVLLPLGALCSVRACTSLPWCGVMFVCFELSAAEQQVALLAWWPQRSTVQLALGQSAQVCILNMLHKGGGKCSQMYLLACCDWSLLYVCHVVPSAVACLTISNCKAAVSCVHPLLRVLRICARVWCWNN